MRYIKLINEQPVDYTIEQLLIDYPNAVIYKKTKKPNEQLLANYGVYPLITEPKPELNDDETAEESTPEFRDGEWHQTWTIRKLTEEENEEVLKNNTSGFIADKKIQKQRYDICQTCEHLTLIKTCNKCGCIMPLKVKKSSATCPLEKW